MEEGSETLASKRIGKYEIELIAIYREGFIDEYVIDIYVTEPRFQLFASKTYPTLGLAQTDFYKIINNIQQWRDIGS